MIQNFIFVISSCTKFLVNTPQKNIYKLSKSALTADMLRAPVTKTVITEPMLANLTLHTVAPSIFHNGYSTLRTFLDPLQCNFRLLATFISVENFETPMTVLFHAKRALEDHNQTVLFRQFSSQKATAVWKCTVSNNIVGRSSCINQQVFFLLPQL